MKKIIYITLILFVSCNNPTTIPLDGSNSYDPDGKIIWQHWEQVSGDKAIIKEPFKLKTEVVLPAKGIYEFRLTVMDNDSATATKVIQKVK